MARGRSLAEFQKAFADEASCATFLFKRRWPDGFVCPACGRRRANALKTRPRLFECLDCGRQTSLTAGTVMHRSRLPLTTWFQAAHLMTTHSNGMSALQLEAQLGVTYKTAWLLTQKLRRSMIDPNRELLEGVVEVDQTDDSVPGWRRVLRARQRGENSDCRSGRGHRARHQQVEAPAQGREVPRHALGPPAPRRDRRQLRRVARSLRARQREAGRDPDHRWTRVLSRPCRRLPARSARRWRDGGEHRSPVEPPCVRVDEALGARHVSRPASQARR